MSEPVVPASKVLKHLAVMCAVAAVLGVVVAGLAIPFAGLLGMGAKDAAKTMNKLPADFEVGNLAQTTKILDAKGDVITTLYDQNRVYRPLSQISRKMTSAIVSIEDYRFYQHGALDVKGTMRAFVTNEANNGTVQGGSSITQQLVKMTLLYNAKTKAQQEAATDDSYARKLRELRYAVALEQAHTKDWILEHYLNAAYFGDGAYGIQSAAKHYFGVNADQLNWKQSATLAGLVKNPTGYDPTNYPDAAITRRNVVLDRMAQLHVIPQAQAEKLKKQKLGLHVTSSRNGCVNSSAPWFCDYTVNYLLQDKALGDTVEARKKLLYSGGLTIQTTMKPAFQKAASTSVKNHVWATDQAIGGLAEVEPGTGNVLALAQSRPMGANAKKGETYIDYTIPKEIGNAPGFQAGSTFKAFVLATAITQGIPLTTTFDAKPHMVFPQSSFANCPGAGNFVGTWPVGNSTSSGVMNVYRGTRESVNTFYAQLEQKTGVCAPFNLAKSMGLYLTNPTGDAHGNGAERVPSFTLGVVNVSPLEMAGAYATFGARGKFCEPHPVSKILDSAGHVVRTYAKKCSQVMPQATADAVNDVLRGVQEPGGFGYDLGHTNLTDTKTGQVIPSAGKTGTTQDGKSVWFMGYTPQVATAAMIAGANEAGTPIGLGGVEVAGAYHSPSGSGFAGPMWADAMHPVEDYLKAINFTKPDPHDIKGLLIDIPSVGCESVSAATAKLEQAGFKVSRGGTDWSSCPVGTVDYTSPSGQAGSGSTIALVTSKGPAPTKPSKPKKSKGGNNSGNGGNGGSHDHLPGGGHGPHH
ncbi:transglycosylase domain-containing protein [Nocardioides sp. DS6]|uniref:Transglycosylase domain-containing protein n=1 Tax=Nocardioides eburneus TaxID=3231482 RepID=A0ABV3SYH6_9ACTN